MKVISFKAIYDLFAAMVDDEYQRPGESTEAHLARLAQLNLLQRLFSETERTAEVGVYVLDKSATNG